jgi:hypothetical protein
MDRPRYLFLSNKGSRLEKAAATKQKSHHPGLDDGPNFSELFATPSPAFAVNYNDLGNSHDATNEPNGHRLRRLLRRHGAAIHSLTNTSRCGRLRVTPCTVAEWGSKVNESN